MARPKQEPKQKTQPKKGKPVEVPVPRRDQVIRNLGKIAGKQKGSGT